MRSDEVGDEVETKSPPDCSEDVAGHLLHPPHHADAVINLGEELEHKDEQKYSHHKLYLVLFDQFGDDQPKDSLHNFRVEGKSLHLPFRISSTNYRSISRHF